MTKKRKVGNLYLDRFVGEKIVIEDNIVITVLSVKGGEVRLGIDAPLSIPVFRTELLEGEHK